MSELRVGLIGGTGLGEALGAEQGVRHEVTTPFGQPSDAIVETTWAGVTTLILSRHGPGHLLNPTQIPFRANIYALKQLGCTHILASGAVGSLREEFRPKDLVIPDQVIDKTRHRPDTFFEKAAVHVEFAEPFDPVLRQILVDSGVELGRGAEGAFATHDRGCYVCMEGPAFSTRAESLMHRLWGGDLIGMTAMPEAKLAREAEIPYALVSLVTDYDCWKQSEAVLSEILGNLKVATENAVRVLRRAVEIMAQKGDVLWQCPAQKALELGIWSKRQSIAHDEVERLRPIWGRYFQ